VFRFGALSVICIVVATGFAHSRPLHSQDFDDFWRVFRKTALEKDWRKLAVMTRFPLTVKGILDRDPVRLVDKREFANVFDEFLRQGVFSENEELEFIRKTTAIPKQIGESLDERRVGDMVFKKTDRGWLLIPYTCSTLLN
jgi:hypothetical protein